jgi:hypothetical protein
MSNSKLYFLDLLLAADSKSENLPLAVFENSERRFKKASLYFKYLSGLFSFL